MMKSERVKLLSRDGFSFSKPIGMVEVYFNDGTSMKIEEVIAEVLKLRQDLEIVTEVTERHIEALSKRVQKIENIQNLEDQIVLE